MDRSPQLRTAGCTAPDRKSPGYDEAGFRNVSPTGYRMIGRGPKGPVVHQPNHRASAVYHPRPSCGNRGGDSRQRRKGIRIVCPDSYVSITNPGWYTLQSAIQASEHVLTHITCTYEGHTPPVRFLVNAWAVTIHGFSEQIRRTHRTLRVIVDNVGSWEHRWK